MTSSWNRAKACISSNAAPASTRRSSSGSPPAPTNPPLAERRAQPLAAGLDHPADLVERAGEVAVEGAPALALGGDEANDAIGDARGGQAWHGGSAVVSRGLVVIGMSPSDEALLL